MFLRALVLGVRHPVRAITAMVLPVALLFVLSRLFIRATVFIDFGLFLGWDDPTLLPRKLGPRVSSPIWQSSPSAAWTVWLISFALLAAWFGTWQRGVVRHFAEPTETWLHASFRLFPAYLLACAIWLLAPYLLNTVLISAASWSLVHTGILAPDAPYLDPTRYNATAPSNVMLGISLLHLPGLWLFARLSTLPPLVAARGRPAVRMGWALSAGRGFMLSLCFGVGILLSIASLYFCHYLAIHLMKSEVMPGSLELYEEARPWLVLVVDRIIWLLTMLWIATLPALIVRSSWSPAAIDPDTFD